MRAWLLLLLLLSLGLMAWTRGVPLPDRFNPWATIDLTAPPDAFTRYKLSRLGEDAPACRSAVRAAGVSFVALPDREEPSGCGWTGALRVSAIGETRLASPVTLSCPLTAGLVLFEREVLRPRAQAAFGSEVRTIEHVGSYACRNIYHREEAPLSRHARADAIDITGFRLGDGRRIGVGSSSPSDVSFLRDVQTEGCDFFGAFLGPDYNAAHRTHFHVQGRGFGFCR